MNKREFIGHMFCDSRYSEIKKKIKYAPIEWVLDLYNIHLDTPRNVRYTDLQKAFDERFNK